LKITFNPLIFKIEMIIQELKGLALGKNKKKPWRSRDSEASPHLCPHPRTSLPLQVSALHAGTLPSPSPRGWGWGVRPHCQDSGRGRRVELRRKLGYGLVEVTEI